MNFRILITAAVMVCIVFTRLSYPAGALVLKAEENGACSGELQDKIVTIKIKPKSTIMFPGGSMQFVATAYDVKGKKVPVSLVWEINSETPGFGTLDRSEGDKVIFNAVNSGYGSVVAVYGSIKGEIPVEIKKSGR